MSGDKASLAIRHSTSSQKEFDGVEVRFGAEQLSISTTNSKSRFVLDLALCTRH